MPPDMLHARTVAGGGTGNHHIGMGHWRGGGTDRHQAAPRQIRRCQRFGKKGDAREDLEKALWYLQRAIARLPGSK